MYKHILKHYSLTRVCAGLCTTTAVIVNQKLGLPCNSKHKTPVHSRIKSASLSLPYINGYTRLVSCHIRPSASMMSEVRTTAVSAAGRIRDKPVKRIATSQVPSGEPSLKRRFK